MIDDERLQELLSKASSLYNNGEYKGAIDAWREALGVDPQSQKAREGIRMATLLLGDFDAAAPSEGPEVTADGAEVVAATLSAEEAEAQLDLGIARVKQLIAERRFSEAIKGAQSLLPLGPDSADLSKLLEEAQHAFESTPFIEEHLTLSRELLSQERFAESEAECKKVFTLDAGHPGGKALLKEIRDKIQESLKAAASQLGGMTVKLTMPQAMAAGSRPKPQAPRPEAPRPPAQEPPAAASPQIPEMYGRPEPGDEPSAPLEGSGGEPLPESGDQAKLQEEVAARATLDAAFEDQALAGAAAEESPFELDDIGVRGPAVAATPAVPPPKKAEPRPETIVEAKTVRPATSRVVPKGPSPETTTAGAPAEVKPSASASPEVAPPPIVAGQPKKTQTAPVAGPAPSAAKGATGAPVAAAPKGTPPAPAAARTGAPAPGIPVAAVKDHDETAAWETELAQLNLKDRERGLLRGTGAKATAAPVDQGEVDLMSLLDTGGMPGAPDSGADLPAAHSPSIPLAHAKETVKPPESAAEAGKTKRRAEAPAEATLPGEAPTAEIRPRPPGRPRAVAATPGSGSSAMKYLLLFILLLGGGGAAWVFYIQPRLLGGAGQPGQPVAPPAGSPAGTVDGTHGPIPTPIGGTSRQQTAPPQPGGGAPAPAGPSAGSGPAIAVKGGDGEGAARPPAEGSPRTGTGVQNGGGAPAGPAAQNGGTAAAAGVARPPEPIKPATVPQVSPEEARKKIVAYTADGRRLMGIGKWREARAKLQAVLALDPANIEVKELADRVQAKIDDDQKLQDEFDSVKKLYADKDYENALRKLYRLPRDKGLGDIDTFIRNAWYDWAVVLMKAGNARDAQQKLSESLTLDPDDASALKLQEVAERYTNRAKDRVYYAFTDSLGLRALDQK